MRLRSSRNFRCYLAVLMLSACLDSGDTVRYVELRVRADECLTPKSSIIVTAEARYSSLFESVLYTSADKPDRFVWRTTSPDTASVESGRVTGHRVGSATIEASTQGVTGYRMIQVEPPVAGIELRAEPAVVRVGDTLTISAQAVDSLGAPLPDAQLQSFVAYGHLTTVGTDLQWRSPVSYRLVATAAGEGRVQAQWYCTGVPRIQESVTISVAP